MPLFGARVMFFVCRGLLFPHRGGFRGQLAYRESILAAQSQEGTETRRPPTKGHMGANHQTREKAGKASESNSSPLESLATPAKTTASEKYTTIEEAVAGLSRRVGLEVDAYFVSSFFAKDPKGTIDLPPKPRVDPTLCAQLADLIKPVNVSARDEDVSDAFLERTFRVGSGRRLSSYEVQLLEFAMQNKNTIEFQFDYRSSSHALEQPLSGEKRVVLGGRHHSFKREYTPLEAWSTFLHEIAHSREATYGIASRNYATGVIFSETRANIYGACGDIGLGIKETAKLYKKFWMEVSGHLPGFDQLTPVEQYRYLSILCSKDQPSPIAFLSQSQELKEAFPNLARLIDKRYEIVLEIQSRDVPLIDDRDFEED